MRRGRSVAPGSGRATQPSRFLDRAILDLRMLLGRDDEGTYVDAGVPWYSALFGRDALITAYQALGVNSDLAWQTLRGLAARQGKEDDDWTEEEPGKILHELRVGELAQAGEIPHTPYYGSVDATPLWLVTLHGAYRWTGDLDAVRELWPNVLEAVRWIDEVGDLDGDGYVEYRPRSPRGFATRDGRTPTMPSATRTGPRPIRRSPSSRSRAMSTRRRSTPPDWPAISASRTWPTVSSGRRRSSRSGSTGTSGCPRRATSPWPWTGDKRQVPTLTSNPGHCLWSRIVDEEKAPKVAHRLLGSGLGSGWG